MIDNGDLIIAANAYFEELAKHADWPDGSLLIDKLYSISCRPLISQIFPDAKFIPALRHPLDSVFSCWMQSFKLNAAMAIMVDLDRIVDFIVAMKVSASPKAI